MKTKLLLNLAALLGVAFTAELHAQTTAFTYQGQLTDNSSPATGLYDLRFTIYDSETNGVEISVLTNATTAVTDGLFTATLDFGAGVFDGSDRWLEIAVNGVTLINRQKITHAPYAIFAGGAQAATTVAAGGVNSNALTTGAVTSVAIADGSIAASDLSPTLASNTFWRLNGNAGTSPGTHFIGSTDGQALELRVNGVRGLRLQPEDPAPSLIGGSPGNFIAAGMAGAVIAGGGHGASTNSIESDVATISGGNGNRIRPDAVGSVISGGYGNEVSVGAISGVISGGDLNVIGSSSWYGVIGGGVGGSIGSDAIYATIGGGHANTIQSSALDATIPGGYNNEAAGDSSFAAGQSARANHDRSFVWSSRDNPAPSFSADRFHVHAAQGLSVDYATQGGNGLGTRWVVLGGYAQFPGETISTWTGARLTDGGVWTDNSDRNAKENFTAVDSCEILERVAALPVQEWNYKTEGPAVRHIGPVAQDFHEAFHTGADDKHLAALDSAGVALAAIQGLNQKVEAGSQKAENSIQELRAENAALQQRLEKLEQLLSVKLTGGAQ